MASSMVAITTDGTRFGCAGISLTEAGVAVLDEGGSRLGFVPYGSLEYVTPCVDDQGAEDGTGLSGDLQVVAADGSAFSCASLSQTAAGVATLAPSGERTGFVPYDTLEYVLPEGETGDASLDCTLPPSVAGAADAADETAEETAEADPVEEEADPVEEEAERGDHEPDADEPDAEESGGVWEDAEDEASADESAGESDTTDDAGAEDEEDGLWEEAEESTDPVDPEAPVVEEEAAAEGSADAAADVSTDAEAGETAGADAEATTDTAADADTTTEGDSQRAEREEAGESEMQVEWSFGEYDE